jgi:hypothetical protein
VRTGERDRLHDGQRERLQLGLVSEQRGAAPHRRTPVRHVGDADRAPLLPA